MSELAALTSAIELNRRPDLSRRARHIDLPTGTTFLLQVAAGEAAALEQARAATGLAPAALQTIAGFYIEQVLFGRGADSYRVLGCTSAATTGDLRRNMALLLKWAHPDVAINGSSDRAVFVRRITSAWEDLKTDERRRDYDARAKSVKTAAKKVSRVPQRRAAAQFGPPVRSRTSRPTLTERLIRWFRPPAGGGA